MKKTLFLLCCMVTHINAMLVTVFPKEINLVIYDHIPTSSFFSSIEEVNGIMTSLVRVNKSWNLCINDSENTLYLIKKLAHRFHISDMAVAEKLSTAAAQSRYTIQVAALHDWGVIDSSNIDTQLNNLLKRKLDLNFTYSEYYQTMLLKATSQRMYGYANVAEWLIKKSANINVTVEDGKDAMMFALYYGEHNVIPLLLSHKDFQIKHQDNNGNTLLHCCFERGIRPDGYPCEIDLNKCAKMCPVIRELLQKGANPYARNKQEKTPFDLATKTGYAPFLEILDSQKNS